MRSDDPAAFWFVCSPIIVAFLLVGRFCHCLAVILTTSGMSPISFSFQKETGDPKEKKFRAFPPKYPPSNL